MSNTTTVATEATNTESLPTAEEFNAMFNATAALDLVSQLKALSESEASKRIDKMSAGDALTLSHIILNPELRKMLSTKLGESTAKHLIHVVCTKVQLASYEADDTTRVQTLKDGEEGWGFYAQQAPLGGFGAEIGFVKQESQDGKFTTQRGAAGFYLRASDQVRPVADPELTKRGADALAAIIG